MDSNGESNLKMGGSEAGDSNDLPSDQQNGRKSIIKSLHAHYVRVCAG